MTSKSITSTWSDAAPELLLGELIGPLIRVLIRNGVTPKDISREFEKALCDSGAELDQRPNVRLGGMQRDCMEVMCRWRRDSRFLDGEGLPTALPIGSDERSFGGLCEAAGVTTDAESLLKVLAGFGAVKIDSEGWISPLTPTFILGRGIGGAALDGLLKQIAGFLRVIDHNTQVGSTSRPRFERMCTVVIADELLPVFERTVRERGQEFIDGLDEWLERHRSIHSSSGNYSEVGAGAYFVDLGNIEVDSKKSVSDEIKNNI